MNPPRSCKRISGIPERINPAEKRPSKIEELAPDFVALYNRILSLARDRKPALNEYRNMLSVYMSVSQKDISKSELSAVREMMESASMLVDEGRNFSAPKTKRFI